MQHWGSMKTDEIQYCRAFQRSTKTRIFRICLLYLGLQRLVLRASNNRLSKRLVGSRGNWLFNPV